MCWEDANKVFGSKRNPRQYERIAGEDMVVVVDIMDLNTAFTHEVGHAQAQERIGNTS